MKTVGSRHNALFKRVREALRRHDDEIVLEGRKQVEDALAQGWKPIELITRGPVREDAIAFTPELFDALSDTRSPQDIIALFERPSARFADLDSKRLIVALDAVQDPGNVGTIVRLAAAFDAGGVVLLPGSADPFSPKAIRSSVGSVLNVAMVTATAEELIASGLPIFYADAAGQSVGPPSGAILVFGNEGAGVSAEIRRAGTPIAVAMSDRVESLNVAASAAILLSRAWEARTH
ncbi:MAG: RNA methyltransferase [Thermoanaerobaculia bacterium]